MTQPPKCQCTPSCTKPPLPRSAFCKDHLRKCDRVPQLSGDELPYEPEKYNKYAGIRESHNCYAYAMGYYNLPNTKGCSNASCPVSYPQPGLASGYPKWSKVDGKRCPDLIARIMGDVPGIKPSTFEKKCPRGMRKIAPVVAPKDDYHFYRQDHTNDKMKKWSHKPGATPVTDKDSTGRPIYDPQLASRGSAASGLHYTEFCGYWCVPTRKMPKLKRGGARSARRTQQKRSARRTRR